ncbi:MAG: class I SAM-dependent methyltransferase [Xanthomonadales bacterium]|nr:class I SAM-dependent methyltransferase [Xanthomonadales bacterium]
MDEHLHHNRLHWDELASIHGDLDSYGHERLVRGESTLRAIERREFLPLLDDQSSVLHLQCHIGLDSISLARHASRVVGVDFSPEAIATANRLGAGMEELSFIEQTINPDLHRDVGQFDAVFASYGVLEWIPDVSAWMWAACNCLKPGGILYLVDTHPLAACLVPATKQGHLVVMDRYFPNAGPHRSSKTGSYADPSKKLSRPVSFRWFHSLGEIVSSAVTAGMEIGHLHEFPMLHYQRFADMSEDQDGYWHLPKSAPAHRPPLMYSLLARRQS